MLLIALSLLIEIQPEQFTFRDQPVSNVAYLCEYKIYRGPKVQSWVRLEYDRGKFRESILKSDGQPASMRIYDCNSNKIAYWIIALPGIKSIPPDNDSANYLLAKRYPLEYLKHHHLAPDSKCQVDGPKCDTLQKLSTANGISRQKVGVVTLAGKSCTTFKEGLGDQEVLISVWHGWVLGKEWTKVGRRYVVTKLEMQEKLPETTFKLKAGSVVYAPKWMHLVAPPGTTLKLVPGSRISGVTLPEEP